MDELGWVWFASAAPGHAACCSQHHAMCSPATVDLSRKLIECGSSALWSPCGAAIPELGQALPRLPLATREPIDANKRHAQVAATLPVPQARGQQVAAGQSRLSRRGLKVVVQLGVVHRKGAARWGPMRCPRRRGRRLAPSSQASAPHRKPELARHTRRRGPRGCGSSMGPHGRAAQQAAWTWPSTY